ncbi:MAG: MATE family efflux transporter [Oscillospiraceae bacterium]|jgi:putative MATE family efflux protein|nr:MATE family efflux transporter [Oscillospiraceae bacterium]
MSMSNQEASTNGIITGSIWKQLLSFFFPILLGTFFQQLYNTVDAIIVGNFVGKEALAAVGGTTSVLINFLLNLFIGISSGATVVIAQYHGGQKIREVHAAVHTSIALAIVSGAAITVIGLAASPYALRAMGTPDDIIEYALTYICIYFSGTIASCIYNMGSGILRAVGDTKRPLYFLIVACMVNIVLDLLFVVAFDWGVAGVGIATVLSQIASAALVGVVLLRTSRVYKVYLRDIRFDRKILRQIMSVGIPAGIQSDLYSISNILIQSSVNSFGTNTIAAWTAYGKIDGLFWMIIGAYGLAITTFVGQNFGAQQYERMRKSVRQCLLLSFASTVLISVLFYFFASPLLQLFTSDAVVLDEGVRITRLLAPCYSAYVLIEVLSGAVRGTGDSLIPTLMVSGGICALRVIWLFTVLPMYRTLNTVLLSYPITWVITSILFTVYYLQGGWLRRQIQKNGYAPEPPRRSRHSAA